MTNELQTPPTAPLDTFLIETLRDTKELHAYLSVALEEFQEDSDIEALLLAVRTACEALAGTPC